MVKTPLLLVFASASCLVGSFFAATETMTLAADIYYKQNPYMKTVVESDSRAQNILDAQKKPQAVCGNNAYSSTLPEIGRIFNTKLDYLAVRAILYSLIVFTSLWAVSAVCLYLYQELRTRFFAMKRRV
ncbi:MAG: hypothetical protein WCT03_03815 [Candidatus Obscuribacterales bacterium]